MTERLNGTVIYVNLNANGNDDGTSWNDAFDDLQEALAIAQAGDSIWVATGTYLPTTTADRTASFTIPNEVNIYGGFVGDEENLSARDWDANPTILSGDIGQAGDNSDNAYHVVTGSNLTIATLLDGVIIENGNADGGEFPGPEQFGGGLYLTDCELRVTNCLFRNNDAQFRGGAVFMNNSIPRFQDCTFANNNSVQDGGAVFVQYPGENLSDKPNFEDCQFSGNEARQGGAIKIFETNTITAFPLLVRTCTFDENGLFETGLLTEGGAVFNQTAQSHRFENCTFFGNFSNRGGAVRNQYSGGAVRAIYTDCRFEGNYTTITGTSGGGAVADGVSGPAETTYLNCIFTNNTADHGGGFYYTQNPVSPTLINCIFDSNQGGGAYLDCANAYFGNCTFYNNTLPGIATLSCSAPVIENCIFWDNFITNIGSFNNNPIFRRCLVPGDDCSALDFAQCEDVIFGEDPLFIEPDSGDFRLMICSPARNAGDNDLLLEIATTDIAGMQRIIDGQVDIGAHEFLDLEPQYRITDVTNVGDSRQPRTLRSSMICADYLPGPDTIQFFKEENDTLLIYPKTALPELRSDSTVIDGSGQPLGTVILDGTFSQSLTGELVFGGINIRGDGMEIYGLTIQQWPRSGIYFQGIAEFAKIGAPGKGNIIFNNLQEAGFGNIYLDGDYHTLQSNYFGVTPQGALQTSHGSAIALSVNPPISSNILIGGNRSLGEGNVIGGCSFGVVSGDLINHNNPFVNIQIKGNYFGTDPSEQAVYPNENGIHINLGQPYLDAYIGGTEDEANIFAHTEEIAISVLGNSQQVYISRNSFYCNMEAIVMQDGANNDILPPVIDTADVTYIAGTAMPGDSVQVYVNDTTSCSITETPACQGKFYLGTVIAEENGLWSLDEFPIQLNGAMVATALAIDSMRNTSFFSNCQTVLCPASLGTLELTLCPDDSVIINDVVYDIDNPQGVETLVGANAIGCDSIVTIELRFFSNSEETLDIDLCEGDSVQVGEMTFSETGQYEILLTNADGCDSLVTLNLMVNLNPIVDLGPDINIFPDETYTLTAFSNIEMPSYEWSTGETTSEITINMPGTYSVTVYDSNGCSATDEIVAALVSSTNDPESQTTFDIVPNPATDQINVQIAPFIGHKVDIQLYNLFGQKVLHRQIEKVSSTTEQLNTTALPPGTYLVEVKSEEIRVTKKLVINSRG